MRGEYRLLCQSGGRGAFAHVIVEREEVTEPVSETVIIMPMVDDRGDLVHLRAEFIEAARDGCKAAIGAIGLPIGSEMRQIVKIATIRVNVADTTPDAVKSAAFLATADSFGAAHQFTLQYKERWIIVPA